MAMTTASARERILDAVSWLFYAEGIRAVGVDRVIAEAGVAKATLYAHFTSKDELVAAYLARQSTRWAAAVKEQIASPQPAQSVSTSIALAPFDVLAERAASPTYRGCPFINAAAEFPGQGPVADQVAAHRRRVRETFSDLIGEAGRDPKLLVTIITLYDGAMSAAYLDRDPTVIHLAREAASEFLRRYSGP